MDSCIVGSAVRLFSSRQGSHAVVKLLHVCGAGVEAAERKLSRQEKMYINAVANFNFFEIGNLYSLSVKCC